ncbi:Hypothetical protein A7982_00324 [Minicystis rosea]|nr:Hypothetical protein A7982_00324 [Minicystis rosea]
MATHPTVPPTEMAKLLENTARKGPKEINMDVLEELKREGERAGRIEGERAGRMNALLELLAARFGSVPEEAKAKILAAAEKTLSRWSIQVLTAPTLAAVLDDAPHRAPSAPRKPRPPHHAPPPRSAADPRADTTRAPPRRDTARMSAVAAAPEWNASGELGDGTPITEGSRLLAGHESTCACGRCDRARGCGRSLRSSGATWG